MWPPVYVFQVLFLYDGMILISEGHEFNLVVVLHTSEYFCSFISRISRPKIGMSWQNTWQLLSSCVFMFYQSQDEPGPWCESVCD